MTTIPDRWGGYLAALEQYAAREGHAKVPAGHVEHLGGVPVKLGAWVAYVRTRRRSGRLGEDQVAALEAVDGWTWGPLRPGPAPETERNAQIAELRARRMSLQKIGDRFGLSRQRVHQILKALGET